MQRRIALAIATLFGSGLLPKAPGTWGSLAAILVCIGALELADRITSSIFMRLPTYVLLMWAVYEVGVRAVPRAEQALGPKRDRFGLKRTHDQPQIVIDELLGMMVTCIPFLFVRVDWISFAVALTAGFVVFRWADVKKFWPAALYETQENPESVMLDDFFVGFYGAAAVAVALILMSNFGLNVSGAFP